GRVTPRHRGVRMFVRHALAFIKAIGTVVPFGELLNIWFLMLCYLSCTFNEKTLAATPSILK
ncbi:hypothetical protein, partial [Klebsiella michiganensis]|uniref:hypothetical protein n=1 Tax=Klebsiella michiganensis TaxID=1134687 RepID=UPI00345C60CB